MLSTGKERRGGLGQARADEFVPNTWQVTLQRVQGQAVGRGKEGVAGALGTEAHPEKAPLQGNK